VYILIPVTSLLSSSVFPASSPTPVIYALSLHDALPIYDLCGAHNFAAKCLRHCLMTEADAKNRQASGIVTNNVKGDPGFIWRTRSEEHTSELQSRFDLVCRLLLEKKNKNAAK